MKVTVVGCGGIGSFLAHHLDRLIDIKQLPDDIEFTFYDDDIVEPKNILYQNFEPFDTDMHKAKALENKYFNLKFQNKRLNFSDLENTSTDLIILCADNNLIRKEVYKLYETKGIKFIDSRANGKCIGLFSNETENYLSTISQDDKPTSCQNPFQLQEKKIEYGNVVIAAMAAQAILTYIRSNKLPNDIILNF